MFNKRRRHNVAYFEETAWDAVAHTRQLLSFKASLAEALFGFWCVLAVCFRKVGGWAAGGQQCNDTVGVQRWSVEFCKVPHFGHRIAPRVGPSGIAFSANPSGDFQ